MPIVSFIPERYEDGFTSLSLMSESDYEALVSNLGLIALVSSTSALASKLSTNIDIDVDVLTDIFDSIGSLVIHSIDEDEILEIVNSLSKVAIDKEIIKESDVENFKKRVSYLLNNPHIYYASKTQSLSSEFNNLYLSSKLVTDIRPIFSKKIEDSPIGAIIIHNIHIHYRADREGDHKDIYLSLDSNDINVLIEELKRAQKKETSLKHIFDKSGMTNLNE